MKFAKKIWNKPRLSFGTVNVKHEPMGAEPINASEPQQSIFVPKSILSKIGAPTECENLENYYRTSLGADGNNSFGEDDLPLVRGAFSDDFSDRDSETECDTIESNRLFWNGFMKEINGRSEGIIVDTSKQIEMSVQCPTDEGTSENLTPHSLSSMSEDASINPRRPITIKRAPAAGFGVTKKLRNLRIAGRRASTGAIVTEASDENLFVLAPKSTKDIHKPMDAGLKRPATTGNKLVGMNPPKHHNIFFGGDDELGAVTHSSPGRKFGTNIANFSTTVPDRANANFQADPGAAPTREPIEPAFAKCLSEKSQDSPSTTDADKILLDQILADDLSFPMEKISTEKSYDIVSIGVSSIEHSIVYESEGDDDDDYEYIPEPVIPPVNTNIIPPQPDRSSQSVKDEELSTDNVEGPSDENNKVDNGAGISSDLQAVQDAYVNCSYITHSPEKLVEEDRIHTNSNAGIDQSNGGPSEKENDKEDRTTNQRFGSAYNIWEKFGLIDPISGEARLDSSDSSASSSDETDADRSISMESQDDAGASINSNHPATSSHDSREPTKATEPTESISATDKDAATAAPEADSKRSAFSNLLQQWKEISDSSKHLLPKAPNYKRKGPSTSVPLVCKETDQEIPPIDSQSKAVVPFYKPNQNASHRGKPEQPPPPPALSCISYSTPCMDAKDEKDYDQRCDSLSVVSQSSVPRIGRSVSDGGDQPPSSYVKDINNFLNSGEEHDEDDEIASPSRALVLFEDSERRSRKYETPTSTQKFHEAVSEGEVVLYQRPSTDIVGYSENNIVDEYVECNCVNSSFSGEDDHISFFLPKMGMACTCGKNKKGLLNVEEPTALENILRPWQVHFLKGFGIYRGEQLVKARHRSGPVLAKALKVWRKKYGMTTFKTSSCEMAIHIWSKTCKSFVRSIRKQIRAGIRLLKQPDFVMEDISEFFEDIPATARRRPSAKYSDRSERSERRSAAAAKGDFDQQSQAEV